MSDKSRFVKEIEEALLARRDRRGGALGEGRAGRLPRRPPARRRPGARGPARCDLRRRRRSTTFRRAPSWARRASAAAPCCSPLRPDLDVRDLRGNVDTRLRRLADGDFDAIVLAQAGLDRLGRGDEGRPLDPDVFVPAAGQGCLALQIRDADETVNRAVCALPGMTGVTDDTTRGLPDGGAQRRSAAAARPATRRSACTPERPATRSGSPPSSGCRTARAGFATSSRCRIPTAASLIGRHVAERLRRAGADELLAEAERLVAAG